MARISLSLTEKPFKDPYFFRVICQIRVLKKWSFKKIPIYATGIFSNTLSASATTAEETNDPN
jgi:hypothetical protein